VCNLAFLLNNFPLDKNTIQAKQKKRNMNECKEKKRKSQKIENNKNRQWDRGEKSNALAQKGATIGQAV